MHQLWWIAISRLTESSIYVITCNHDCIFDLFYEWPTKTQKAINAPKLGKHSYYDRKCALETALMLIPGDFRCNSSPDPGSSEESVVTGVFRIFAKTRLIRLGGVSGTASLSDEEESLESSPTFSKSCNLLKAPLSENNQGRKLSWFSHVGRHKTPPKVWTDAVLNMMFNCSHRVHFLQHLGANDL